LQAGWYQRTEKQTSLPIHIQYGPARRRWPAGFLADLKAVDPNVTPADAQRLARRVLIRFYAPDTSVPTVQSALLEH
jgi:hypothetical protein